MKQKRISNSGARVAKFLSDNSAAILIGTSISASISACVMVYKTGPKAKRVLEEVKNSVPEDASKATLLWEETKALAPIVWPAVTMEAISIGCAIGSYKASARRTAAFATAYSISESRLQEYQRKVVETLGEKKEAKIRDEIAKERIKNDPVSSNQVYVPENGETLCYDTVSGRYFRSTRTRIERIVNELNGRLRSDMYISLNEFYNELGLPEIAIGEDMGWGLESGIEDIAINFSTQFADDDVTPCVVVDYYTRPRFDFRNLH